jgi:hypothetical protein
MVRAPAQSAGIPPRNEAVAGDSVAASHFLNKTCAAESGRPAKTPAVWRHALGCMAESMAQAPPANIPVLDSSS